MSKIKNILLYIHTCGLLGFIRFMLNTFKGVGGRVRPVQNDLLKQSATSLAQQIRQKKITSVELLEIFIARIKEVNPLLNCVVDNRFNDAHKDAIEADKLIASGKYTEAELEREKPFLGVPISTKDCIAVKGLLHTGGITARKHIRAPEDSTAISLMRQAGAIPFALTNVSECCMWWESSNTVHGRSRNPYDSNRIVGGSSGGEACLLAASGSPIGIGSDIGGSIRMPAFFNGIFGHKPSKFIVSNIGQWPFPNEEQSSFLGLGPMSRYAVDLKPVLKIIAGENASKLNLDEPVDLKNIKVFYQLDDGGAPLVSPVDADIKESLLQIVDHFSKISQHKPQQKKIKLLKQSTGLWLGNMKSNTTESRGFDSQLLNLQGHINPYWELLKWTVGKSNHTLIALLTVVLELFGVKYGSSKHKHLVQQKVDLIQEFGQMLGTDGVFLYPTHPTPALYHNEPIVKAFNFSYTGIINILGLPATAIPMGLGKEGLPIGIQVVSNVNNDRLCLAVANELERVFGGYVEPGL